MVPLGPPLLAYKSNCKAMLTAADDAVQLVVDRPYKAGEAIVVWYSIFLTPMFSYYTTSFAAFPHAGDAFRQCFIANCIDI